jgi:hypothetical protein
MKDLEKINKIKLSLNKKLSDLDIQIKVDSSFIIMLLLLLEEIKANEEGP